MAGKLVKLEFQPGLFANGTRYQSRDRWIDAALVRFFEKTIRPIGGWVALQNTVPIPVGQALFTGAGPTDFQSYTPDLGLGVGDRGSSDALAWQVTGNQLRKMDNIFAQDWVTFSTTQLYQDLFTVRSDIGIKASLNDYAGFLFRCNAFVSDNGSFGCIGVFFERTAVDTFSVKFIRILNGAVVVGESATLATGVVLTGADASGFAARVAVNGRDLTIGAGPVGGTVYATVATKTMTTDLNDASHKGFGIIGHHSASSGAYHVWDRYEVAPALPADFGIDLTLLGTARALLAWLPNGVTSPNLAIGTNTKALIYNLGTVSDITPSDLVLASDALLGVNTTDVSGMYGGGAYGSGVYGSGDTTQSARVEAASWQFDTFGQYLVGVHTVDGRLLSWGLTGDMQVPSGSYPVAGATVSGTAPVSNDGVVVTAERFAFVLGAGGDGRKVQWPSRETLTDWAVNDTTTAGSYYLPGNGVIMCGLRAAKSTLIFTTEDLFEAQYIGGTLLYAFTQVGQKCGILSRHAATIVDGKAFWMGLGAFFKYDGTVRPLECDVGDFVFKDLNLTQAAKIFCTPMTRFGEIWWFYPTNSSDEPNRYVIYNYRENTWNFGPLTRTAGIDRGAFDKPIMATPLTIYQHEIGSVRPGGVTPYLTSGPLEIGDRVMNILKLVPDEATLSGQSVTAVEQAEGGSTRMYISTASRPDSVETLHGPYTLTEYTDVRLNARLVRVRYEEAVAGDWRIGVPAAEVSPGGLR